MGKKLFLLFNHRITERQREDAAHSLGVEQIVAPPTDLKALWAGVPPEIPELSGFLTPFRQWLEKSAAPGDAVLIQGDFGACYAMVRFCLKQGFAPVYSTTERTAHEEHRADGSVVITHQFSHVRFRKYGR